MLTLIQNADLYQPAPAGKKDLLIAGEKILRIDDRIEAPAAWNIDVIDAAGRIVCPGFVDLHTHMLGGGEEGGFGTRTPEIVFSRITAAAVTTVVGRGFSLAEVLALVTKNPARRVGLADCKGGLFAGADADLLILAPELAIDAVIARGRVMVRDGNTLVKGTFEEKCKNNALRRP